MHFINDGVRDDGPPCSSFQRCFHPEETVSFDILEAFQAGPFLDGLVAAVHDISGAVIAEVPETLEGGTAQAVQHFVAVQAQARQLARGLVETDTDVPVPGTEIPVFLHVHLQRAPRSLRDFGETVLPLAHDELF